MTDCHEHYRDDQTSSYFNELRRGGMNVGLAVVKGTVLRLRPVLITASVAALGLVPMLFATGPGSEIPKPLAAVVIGGLISSTLLTLFMLPTLYKVFEREPVMVGEQAQEMQLAHWIPTTPIGWLENIIPPWMGLWFAVFPTRETLVAQLIATILVLGSYFATRHLKIKVRPDEA
jgi:predicted RND superfamily exporter protein